MYINNVLPIRICVADGYVRMDLGNIVGLALPAESAEALGVELIVKAGELLPGGDDIKKGGE